MRRELVMGVDVGSTGVKAGLFDRDLVEPVATAAVHYVAHQPSAGISEHSAELLTGSSVAAMRQLAAKLSDTDQVVAIAVCAMMSGGIPIDRRGEALAPYTTTLDQRSDRWLLDNTRQHGDRIFQMTGSAQPVLAAKISWLQEALGGDFRKVAKVLPAGPFVAGRLAGLDAGNAFIDPTYLWMTGLADVRKDSWSSDLADLLSIDASLLPDIRASTDIVGTLDEAVAAETGLVAGTPVVAGSGDQLAGYLGAGLNRPGKAADVAGTYASFAIATAKFSPALVQRHECVRAAIPGLWFTQSFVAGAGLNAGWFCASVVEGRGLDEGASHSDLLDRLSHDAADLPPGADGVFFVPHLGGQAFPLVPTMRGAWLGLSWNHRRDHMFRALLEGLAYEHRLSFQERSAQPGFAKPEEVITYGGGAANALWRQIKADVMGVPYRRLPIADPAARGCAMLAAAGIGMVTNIAEDAPPSLFAGERVEPNADNHAAYRTLVERYDALVRALPAV